MAGLGTAIAASYLVSGLLSSSYYVGKNIALPASAIVLGVGVLPIELLLSLGYAGQAFKSRGNNGTDDSYIGDDSDIYNFSDYVDSQSYLGVPIGLELFPLHLV